MPQRDAAQDAALAAAADCRERGDWRGALALLTQVNRQQPRAALQQQMVDWRIQAGRTAVTPLPEKRAFNQAEQAEQAEQANEAGPAAVAAELPGTIPEIPAQALTAERLHQAIHSHGALIVRGLLDRPAAAGLAQQIDRVVAAREDPDAFPPVEPDAAWYVRSAEAWGKPSQFFRRLGQGEQSSSIWVADSPRVACELLALYEALGLPALLQAYFGEPARLSVKKWVLRKMAPKKDGDAGWHQDGRFLGEDISTVNLWLALSDCGGDAAAPGMDLLADGRREIHPTGTDGAWFDWTVGPERVARLAADIGITQPRFAPGDALLFDHYSLHRTALEDHHTAVRYAIESWFFAASSAPAQQQPLFF